MGDLFKALSSSLARFVFAWMTPSAVSLGLFCLIVLPAMPKSDFIERVSAPGKDNAIVTGLIFAFFVLILSILFAYASLPIYRLLEGFLLPAPWRRRLIRKHRRNLAWLQAVRDRARRDKRPLPVFHQEALDAYPEHLADVRATKLGNALAAMENFSVDRYGLESQRMWYELLGIATEATRRDTEEGRAPVDFFVSSITHLSLLGAVSIPVSFVAVGFDTPSFCLGVFALALVPLAYRGAVSNMTDWSASVKALVNLNRIELAERLGLELPESYGGEQDMWLSYVRVVEHNEIGFVEAYDSYRRKSS